MSVISTNEIVGSLKITKEDAKHRQWNFIHDWEPKFDTWILRYGPAFAGSAAGISGLVINYYYRSKLKCGKYGMLSSYIPCVALPTIFAGYIHGAFVASDIILEPVKCPACYETRAMVFQGLLGIIYPMILAPTCSYLIANQYSTARVPVIHQEIKKFWEFHKVTSRTLYSKIYYLTALNIITIAGVTYFEQKNMLNLIVKMKKIEEDVKARGLNIDTINEL